MTNNLIDGSNRLRQRRGAMLVFVAVSMVGLLGMLALTLDVGDGSRRRRGVQGVADAAAVSGAMEIYRRSIADTVRSAALHAAIVNGATAGVTVNYPPASGPHANDAKFVEVILAETAPTILATVVNVASLNIGARAVAGLGGPSTYCVISLATSGNGIDIPGSLATNGCGVAANSSIYVKKDITGTPTPTIEAVGSITPSTMCSSNCYPGAPPVVDPLASLPVPAETICDHNGVFTVSGTMTLLPGVYCGGIDTGNNGVANLNSGTYVLRGGGITGSGTLNGSGVTLINTNGPGNNMALFKPFNLQQSCTVNLSASTSGTYQGIVLFGDPAGPAGAVNSFCGKGSITGTLYFPNQTFELGNGNGKLTITGSLIASVITTTNGGGQLEMVSDTSGNSALKRPSLVQ